MVDVITPLARLFLVGVFTVAGTAKIADLPGARRAVAAFGMPPRASAVFGTLLPLAELAVAAALLPSSTAVYAAGAALCLLLAFVGAIAVNLARGRAPDCHCFGQFHTGPIGRGVLIRNIALAAVAAFALVAEYFRPGPSLVAWLVELTAFERAVLLGGGAALALLAIQITLLRRLLVQSAMPSATADLGTFASDADGRSVVASPLPIGALAPMFSLVDLDGRRRTLDTLRVNGNPIVLAFSDPGCRPCVALWPAIASWQRDYATSLTLAVISRGVRDANAQKAVEHGVNNILLQVDREVALAYGVRGTPAAITIDGDGLIASLPVQGESAIRTLIEQVARPAHASQPAPAVDEPELEERALGSPVAAGELVPTFTLDDLDGVTVSLSAFRGMPTVLVFWRPSCGFCRRMTDDFLEHVARLDRTKVRVLVLSTDTPEENRSIAEQAPVVLDPDFSVGRRLGLRGTPSAVLIDADGRLADAVAVGPARVLALLNRATAMPLDGGARPVRRDGFQDELLADGGLLLYREKHGKVLTLNATAALVWEYCDGEHTVDEIASAVRDVFPSAVEVEADVSQLITSLLDDNAISFAAGLLAGPADTSVARVRIGTV